MGTEKLEAQLAIAKVQEEYEALRPKVEGGKASDDERKKYRELNNTLAQMVTQFKTDYPANPPAEGDAAAAPEPVSAAVNKKKG